MIENQLIQTNDAQLAVPQQPEQPPLVTTEKIANYYEEAIQNLKEDREEADEKFHLMFDRIINGGDATNASKELAANLLKMKLETTSGMIKILDLWTRVHLKENNTMPDWAKTKQNVKNQQININTDKKQLIDIVDKMGIGE